MAICTYPVFERITFASAFITKMANLISKDYNHIETTYNLDSDTYLSNIWTNHICLCFSDIDGRLNQQRLQPNIACLTYYFKF